MNHNFKSRWYPLRSKPGQEHKMDYRGAVEIRVQFLVKSSMHSTPVLNSPSENSAAAKKSVSPEPRTSQTPSSTKYEDVTNLLKEPADTNVSVKTESFEASESTLYTIQYFGELIK